MSQSIETQFNRKLWGCYSSFMQEFEVEGSIQEKGNILLLCAIRVNVFSFTIDSNSSKSSVFWHQTLMISFGSLKVFPYSLFIQISFKIPFYKSSFESDSSKKSHWMWKNSVFTQLYQLMSLIFLMILRFH